MEHHFSSQFAKLDALLKIGFEKSEIALNIPEDGRITEEGWKITPITPPVVCYVVALVITVLLLSLIHLHRLLSWSQMSLAKGSQFLSVS